MLAIHPQARTTPAVRAEIARSHESSGVLAKRYGVSTETIRKWRKRGPADCQDRSARPHKLPWKASEEERAIVCALRRATGFPLDDLTFIVSHFLPHLNRDAVYRILKAEGLNRLPPADRTRKPHGTFKDYEVGFVHMDVKHLPKLRDRDGQTRNATSTSPSIAPPASCTWRSRTTRPPPQPSPSWTRRSAPFRSRSHMC
jgi:transposase